MEKLVDAFNKLESEESAGEYLDQIHERTLKKHLVTVLYEGITSSSPADNFDLIKALKKMLKNHFIDDQITAFVRLLEMPNNPEKDSIREDIYNQWSEVPDLFSKYIICIASLDTDDFDEQIRKVMSSPKYNIVLAEHSRAISRSLSLHRERTVYTSKGLNLLKEVFLKIGKVNQMCAQPILNCFDEIEKYDEDKKKQAYAALEEMQAGLDPVKEQSLYNRLNIILKKV